LFVMLQLFLMFLESVHVQSLPRKTAGLRGHLDGTTSGTSPRRQTLRYPILIP